MAVHKRSSDSNGDSALADTTDFRSYGDDDVFGSEEGHQVFAVFELEGGCYAPD